MYVHSSLVFFLHLLWNSFYNPECLQLMCGCASGTKDDGSLFCSDNQHLLLAHSGFAEVLAENELSWECIMSLISPRKGAWTLVTTKARWLWKQINWVATVRDKYGCTRISPGQREWWRSLLVFVCVRLCVCVNISSLYQGPCACYQ